MTMSALIVSLNIRPVSGFRQASVIFGRARFSPEGNLAGRPRDSCNLFQAVNALAFVPYPGIPRSVRSGN